MQKKILLYNFTVLQIEGLIALFEREKKYEICFIEKNLRRNTDLIKRIEQCEVILFENIEINESIFRTIEFIRSINRKIKLIALGRNYERELVKTLQYSDVLLDANVNFQSLLNAIEKVISEGIFIEPSASSIYVEFLKENINKKTLHITNREIEVLQLICSEKSSKEIGNLLEISSRTVENHRKSLLIKTKSKGTAGLVKFALKNNIIAL